MPVQQDALQPERVFSHLQLSLLPMARGGTPLGFGAPSLETSYQSQIDDLVQRNRTLEYTNKKLADQIALEKAKASEAVAEAQKYWRQEQIEWRQGCDVLQSCHRVVQLQNVLQLEQEHMNVLKEQEVTRKEKLLRLQRDFRITMFQAREAELEDKIRDLEEDQEDLLADFEEAGRQHDQRLTEYVTKLNVKDEEILVYEEERAELQVEMAPVMAYKSVNMYLFCDRILSRNYVKNMPVSKVMAIKSSGSLSESNSSATASLPLETNYNATTTSSRAPKLTWFVSWRNGRN